MEQTRKRLIITILDTMFVLFGIIAACYLAGESINKYYFLLCCTAIPFFVNNFLLQNHTRKSVDDLEMKNP